MATKFGTVVAAAATLDSFQAMGHGRSELRFMVAAAAFAIIACAPPGSLWSGYDEAVNRASIDAGMVYRGHVASSLSPSRLSHTPPRGLRDFLGEGGLSDQASGNPR